MVTHLDTNTNHLHNSSSMKQRCCYRLIAPLPLCRAWLSVETLELLGSWSNMECRRVQSWVLSFTCYIGLQPTSSHILQTLLIWSPIYADDVQAFVHGPHSDQLALIGRIDALSRDLHLCMSSNRLSLNANKTQFICPNNF